MENLFVCSICRSIVWGKCYSSEPVVTKGICCEKCRNEVVKPRVKFFLDAVFQTK